MENATVVITTHDLEGAGSLRDAFEDAGHAVELVTPSESLSDVDEPALVIVTGELRGEWSSRLLEEARGELHLPVFVVGEEDADRRRVIRELEVDECFVKPVDPDEVLLLGERLMERRRLQEITGIVGESDPIREALERVVQFAPVSSTVLITGESGTGKELVARGIHALSGRKHRPFIAVNVAALSDTLLESELFGHEKGAFTGAVDSRKGLFELANRGTIFLDEIGEMPLKTQTKLLRVLEQREFLRVGGEDEIEVDIRVIAATNRELRKLVAMGEFRRDLYYRLNVLHIGLPPLRERTGDIPLLVEAFVREIAEKHDKEFVGISDEAMEILKSYHWPGNVRELRNLVESMVVLAPGRQITPDDIPEEIRTPGASRSLLPARLPERARSRADEEAGEGEGGTGELRPELEFVFRTLVELRMDVDDLRRDFEEYRREHGELGAGDRPLALPSGEGGIEIRIEGDEDDEGDGRRIRLVGEDVRDAEEVGEASRAETPDAGGAGEPGGGERAAGEREAGDDTVVYRPGKTMEDLEREAIAAALRETGGNRRKAAESLGIGERTLYRKIRKYGIEE